MAEGGHDPETTIPFDPHGDDEGTSEKIPLLPEGTGIKHRFPVPSWKHPSSNEPPVTKTSTSQQHETSFIDDTTSAKVYVSRKEQEIDEANRIINKSFPNAKIKDFTIGIDEFNRVYGKLNRSNATKWIIINSNGDVTDLERSGFPKTISKNLGKTHVEINQENYEKQQKEEEKQSERISKHEDAIREEANNKEELQDAKKRTSNLQGVLREQLEARNNTGSPEEIEDLDRKITRTRKSIKTVGLEVDGLTKERGKLERATIDAEAQVNEGERSVETARERVNERLLSLRDRVKEIFKKYGFTVVSVLTAIGVVIGVIVSNLKAGLTSVAKGVGNGLKELGKKLGEILPGMIGAIASFIFRTAGEVIGFLAKNAWLLIVGLVLLAIEQFKKKSK